ncbi:hypothetical protein SAMD00023353_0601990 [Rosellinia necatrix]|uniref:Methyltransferase domain-containing protein n=1 Tax=Rosellinia necatrix TaxID=77044 RepID=A0A1S7UL56_ROSNE|nr:hypothetical protein SAMD00023353_0601990 [Rosellinia necatrix]
MASTIPITNARNAGEKSRSRRIGALLDLSRGDPPLTAVRRNPRMEPHVAIPLAGPSSRPRPQISRIPQSPPSRKPPTQADVKISRPPLTHETQSLSTSSRSGIPMAKPITTVNSHIEPLKQPRNILRRKQSTILKDPSNIYAHNQSRSDVSKISSVSLAMNPQTSIRLITTSSDQSTARSPGEARMTQHADTHRPMAQPNPVYPELDRYRDIPVPPSKDQLGRDALYRLATEDLPPPTPQFSGASSHSQLSSFSASPSTRFSGSPGPGPYSRDTTPTSISSQSPGLVVPIRLPATRVRQQSPAETRPPVTRRRTGSVSNEGGSFSSDPQGLAAVREALTSSSSNSTVRAEEKNTSKGHRRHGPTPPSPPPRKSSQKFQKGRSIDKTQSSALSPQSPSQSVVGSASPEKPTRSARNRAPSIAQSPQRRPTPPRRPSRDGTPDLYSQFGGPVPIIHSNLSSTSLTERRQSGQLQASSLPRVAQRPSHEHPGSARPSFSRELTPAPQLSVLSSSQTTNSDTGKGNGVPSPTVSMFKSRFPLFGRRTRAGPEAPSVEKKRDKVTRKGPAAGTGHEGYGRVGAVKRRSSAASALQRGIPGLVSSSESLASTLSTDQFLLERMSPVIIAGGEVVENQNRSSGLFRTESNQSTPWGRPGTSSQSLSAMSPSTRDDNRQTLWPSPSISEAARSRRPSENSDLEIMMRPTLAHRTAPREFQPEDDQTFHIPKRIHTRTSSAASMATTIHTDDSSPDIQTEQNHILLPANPPTEKLTKRAKSPRRWNIFGRSQASSSSKKPAESVSTAIQVSQSKSPAFYTIIGSPKQDEVSDKQDMKAMLREAPRLPTTSVQPNYSRRPSTSSSTIRTNHAYSGKDVTGIYSKSSEVIPQIWQLGTGQERRHVELGNTQPSISRPSRLPQVGRIPKVVASRPEQTSPKSFSRPFNRISVQLLPVNSAQPDQDSVAKGPSPPESMVSTVMDTESLGETSPSYPIEERIRLDNPPILVHPGQEFLTFPPPENLKRGESSESSCSDAPGYISQNAQTSDPIALYGEDDVWDEYNDLLEDSPPSPTSSCGVPFPLETYNSNLIEKSTKPLESPTFKAEFAQDVRVSVATTKTATTASHHSADMTARINAAFRFDAKPLVTPSPVSEFALGYSDRTTGNTISDVNSKEFPQDSSSTQESSKAEGGSERGSQSSNRASGSSGVSEETPLSQVNIRVGSMTVAKWLTFGHVLFSPVREDLISDDSTLNRQSILMIDGLGNDDWSFYSAETFPKVNFFNLSPRPPLPQEHQTASSFPASPPNHHQIQFTSHADKFPFGPDSFTALVFRFPSAAPEAHYRNIISEAQRVLKPGGFIEFSILDVDLNNMGGRTRRAVRHLKEQVSAKNPDFSLGSTADLILRVLGKKGFVDIKTCRVGLPVANSITTRSTKNGKKDERSLAEMMNDNTDVGDEHIAGMVSKVGRWWYTRCYELPTGMGRSIWRDRALLTECAEWGTSLKLTVCHARMPEARGRMASI